MVYLSVAAIALTASISSAFAPPTAFGSQALLGTSISQSQQQQTFSQPYPHPHLIRKPQPLFATHKISGPISDVLGEGEGEGGGEDGGVYNNIPVPAPVPDHRQASLKRDVVREIKDRARAVEAQTAALREAIEEEQVSMQQWAAQRMQQTLPPISLDIGIPELLVSGGTGTGAGAGAGTRVIGAGSGSGSGSGAAIASRPDARSATISLLVGGGAVAAAGGPAVASSPEVIQQWPMGLAAFAALPFLAFNGDGVHIDALTNLRSDFDIGPHGGGNIRTLASVLPSNYVEINRFEQGIVNAKEMRAAEMEMQPALKDLDVASTPMSSVTIASAAAAAVADNKSSIGGLGRIVSGAIVVAAAAVATTKRESMIDATTKGSSSPQPQPKRKQGDFTGLGGYFDLAVDIFDQMTGNVQESAKELKAKNYLKLTKNAEGALAAEVTASQCVNIKQIKEQPVKLEVRKEAEVAATVHAIEIEPELVEVQVTEVAKVSAEQQPTTVAIIENKVQESNSIQQLNAHVSKFMALFHKQQVLVRSALFCAGSNNKKMQEEEAIKIQSHLFELASLNQYPSVRVKSPLFYVVSEAANIEDKNGSKSWIRVQLSKLSKIIYGSTWTAAVGSN
eukprot:CAMPEP_0194099594 /NCGR_PEP_ID=MMETSP0150-20130528/735_1 /TAXON_ID=122233 /ORGANISM="Chaetoceros debilis, Strain MM31A-1" /LENGTH=620 /DNA_ID=CAMNT_0038785819 /DNA_START=9 /DNA_END=1871 /DNA_ORIENTATION=+